MRTILLLSLLVACSKKTADDPPAKPAAAPAATTDALSAQVTAFFMKVADAMDTGDCDKLAAGLEATAPDAKAIHDQLVAAGKKLDDVPPGPAVADRMQKLKDPGIIDRCEKDDKAKARLGKALDNSLLLIVPLFSNPDGLGEAFGKAFAPTAK